MAKLEYPDVPLPEQRRLRREAEQRKLDKEVIITRKRLQTASDEALRKWARKAE
jgi:hypothetical protein